MKQISLWFTILAFAWVVLKIILLLINAVIWTKVTKVGHAIRTYSPFSTYTYYTYEVEFKDNPPVIASTLWKLYYYTSILTTIVAFSCLFLLLMTNLSKYKPIFSRQIPNIFIQLFVSLMFIFELVNIIFLMKTQKLHPKLEQQLIFAQLSFELFQIFAAAVLIGPLGGGFGYGYGYYGYPMWWW